MKRTRPLINLLTSRQGSAMGTAIVLVLLGSLLVGSLTVTSRQALSSGKFNAEMSQARLIAEAGAHAAFAELAEDWSKNTDPDALPLTDYAGGTYDAAIAPVPGSGNLYTISSVGTYGSKATVTVAMTVRPDTTSADTPGSDDADESGTPAVPPPDVPPPDADTPDLGRPIDHPAFDCALLAGGEVDFCGWSYGNANVQANSTDSKAAIKVAGGSTINGGVATPGGIQVSGSGSTITGDAYASAYPSVRAIQILGAKPGPGDIIEVPTAADFPLEAWKQTAKDNSQYFEDASVINSVTEYTAPGGVIWVEGEVKLSSHANINGSIIATEGIQVSADSTIRGVEGVPAAMAIDGRVKISAHSTIYGPVVATAGDVEVAGHAVINGGYLIAGADVKVTGQGGINLTYSDWPIAPTLPPDDTADDPETPEGTDATADASDSSTPPVPAEYTDLYFVAWQK